MCFINIFYDVKGGSSSDGAFFLSSLSSVFGFYGPQLYCSGSFLLLLTAQRMLKIKRNKLWSQEMNEDDIIVFVNSWKGAQKLLAATL